MQFFYKQKYTRDTVSNSSTFKKYLIFHLEFFVAIKDLS